MPDFDVHKNAIVYRVSAEVMAMDSGFYQRGHKEPVEWTDQETADVERAHELVREIEKNPYIRQDRDGEIWVDPPPTERFIPDETHDEWIARWRASLNEGKHDD